MLAVFAVSLVQSFHNVDLGDTGNHLINQRFLVREGVIPGPAGLTLLSDVAGGLWCACAAGPSLCWAMVGGAVLSGLNAALAYSVLGDHFPRRLTFAIVLLSSLLIVALQYYPNFIHYYTFPAFLLNCLLFALNKLLCGAPTRPVTLLWAAAVGAFYVLLVLARLPIIVLCIGLPFLVVWMASRRGTRSARYGAPIALLSGLALTVLLSWLAMASLGLFGQYLGSIRMALCSDLDYHFNSSPVGILSKYLARGPKALAGGATFVILFYFVGAASRRCGAYVGSFLIVCISLLLLFLKADGLYSGLARFREFTFGVVLVLVFGTIAHQWRRRPELCMLLLSGVFCMLALNLGTYMGFQPITFGMWIPLPGAILGSLVVARKCRWLPLRHIPSLKPCVFASMAVLFIAVESIPWMEEWRRNNSSNCWACFQSDGLRGMFGEYHDVQTIDGAIAELRTLVKKGDVVLCYNHAALLCWLTETRCFFSVPCLYLDNDSPNRIRKEWEDAEAKGYRARVLILANRSRFPEVDRVICFLKSRYVMQQNYKMAFRNEWCEIYVQ